MPPLNHQNMIQLEYTNEIVDTGLSKEQAIVYEVLLKLGESAASVIVKSIPSGTTLSRPLVYKVLEELIELDLASKANEAGKIAKFTPKHPVAITKVIDKQREKIEHTKKQFLTTSGKLSSLFNLSVGKPGVQFYEGKDGVWEVLLDSLTASEEILSYADTDAVSKYIPDLNAEYSTMREDQQVKKRVMIMDSPAGRKFMDSYDHGITKAKLMRTTGERPHFQSVMQIYDNKISYITLTDEYLIGIVITDQYLADTHKYLFESMWDLSSGEVV